MPTLSDVKIAKNYLTKDELFRLNRMVSAFFDLAEINAIEHKPMYMSDYVEQLDSILTSGNRKLLEGPGKVSHEKALSKARPDYPRTKRNYYASVKKNTTKILLFSNILKQINSTKENSIRFWKSIGFTPNGKDEYDIPLFIKKAGSY